MVLARGEVDGRCGAPIARRTRRAGDADLQFFVVTRGLLPLFRGLLAGVSGGRPLQGPPGHPARSRCRPILPAPKLLSLSASSILLKVKGERCFGAHLFLLNGTRLRSYLERDLVKVCERKGKRHKAAE